MDLTFVFDGYLSGSNEPALFVFDGYLFTGITPPSPIQQVTVEERGGGGGEDDKRQEENYDDIMLIMQAFVICQN